MTKRNNEERLGLDPSGAKESADPPIPAPSHSDGLSFVAPTQLVDLPSEGKFYPEGHPLHNKKTIEIREMTAKEEDILTSQSLIKKGIVLERLLQSVIVDARIEPRHLLLGDKNAIFLAARISGYGAEYQTTVTCPNCAATQTVSFDLDEVTTPEVPDMGFVSEKLSSSVRQTDDGTFLVELPRSSLEIELRLIDGEAEKRIIANLEARKKQRLTEKPLTEHLKACIVSIAGTKDKAEMHKFIDNMPIKDSRFIRKVMQEITPNIDLTQEFVCAECDYEQDMEVPINLDFFWPDE